MLLHWGNLEPYGPSNLASIRFSSPVRIRTIRIHPKGASLFTLHPEIISKTEPDAFALSVFITAQSSPTVQDPKPRATNVLVPTRLSYPGSLREFPLDMGPDFVTKLMIVQGDFTCVTLSVYGDVISEPVITPVSYESTPLPRVTHHCFSSALDPCNAADPSFLSRELLALTPEAPAFSLVIRLMCCLRAPELPWNLVSFVYSDLEGPSETDLSGVDWLTRAIDTLMSPVRSDVNRDALKKFAEQVSEASSEKTNDTLYMIAAILRYASAQPSIVLHAILDALDLSDVIDINLLDKHIVDQLQDAAANPIVARALRAAPILDTLQSLRDAGSTSRALKDAIAALLQRLSGWEQFEKALIAPIPDIAAVGRWIRGIASDDMTFGVFLLSLIEDESLASKFSGYPVGEQGTLPITLWSSTGLASLPEFITFMRAFMGISCVVVTLCWSNYISETPCTVRILAMIRLWQEVSGYREIANHLLLIPQVTHHLENILKSSRSAAPSTGLIHAEQIMACLCAQPETMSRPEVSSLVHSISDLPASISEEERQEMMEISIIAEGGLPEAVHEVLNWTSRPVESSGASTLQTALLILENALEDREAGEWKVMQAAWQAGSHGLIYCLVEMLTDFVGLIRNQFLLTPPPPLRPPVLLRLLASSNNILRILSRILYAQQLPSRLIRNLTRNIASLFIATDAADSRYSKWGAVCQAVRVTRPTCAEVIAVLSSIPSESQPGRVHGELVLRTLFHSSLYPEGDDPVTRLEQVFWLLDLVLPLSLSDASGDRAKQRLWTRNIIPNVLPELQRFMRALAVDHQVQLVKRLADLDRGEVALGQWFVDEELKYLISAVESFTSQPSSEIRSISMARVSNSFQFLSGLIKATSTGGTLQFFGETRTIEDTSHILARLLDDTATVSSVLDFTGLLAPHASLMEPPIHLELTLMLLRGGGVRPSALLHARTMVFHIQHAGATDITRIARELGPTLQCVMEGEDWQSYWQQQEELVTQAILSILSWLVSQQIPDILLPGISEASFTALLQRIVAADPANEKITSDFLAMFIFSDDITMRPIVEEPRTLALSTDHLKELLALPPIPPSTPRLSGESIFKMATLSPVTALVGTSKISTLTKTYQNNDFRQLSVRQNTSRRPSMHVDDFELGSTDLASPTAIHPPSIAPLLTADLSQPPLKPENE